MRERPILFSAPMIRALLAGTKTQTRRIVCPQQPKRSTIIPYELELTERDGSITAYTRRQFIESKRNRFGGPGDRLWVREAWRTVCSLDELPPIQLAESVPIHFESDDSSRGRFREPVGRYRHARFMPRWVSRITLELASVRVERLQEISESDAVAEGVASGSLTSATENFEHLWSEINGADSWDANPFVWALSFRRVEVEQADVERQVVERLR